MTTLRERPASMRYIEKFGRVVLIDDEHPLVLAQRAPNAPNAPDAPAPVVAVVSPPSGTARTGDPPAAAPVPAPTVASAPDGSLPLRLAAQGKRGRTRGTR